MFRNVTGAQEAVVHRQSIDSLTTDQKPIRLIKDMQSDDIAQTYVAVRRQWFDEREQLLEKFKDLQDHSTSPEEIEHVRKLIDCLNELIDHGEVNKNCQTLLNGPNYTIHPLPETHASARKSLRDRSLQSPRRPSQPVADTYNSLEGPSADALAEQRSDEKLEVQDDTRVCTDRRQRVEPAEHDDTSTSCKSTGKMTTGIQFYVVAEHFRNQINTTKDGRKHYFSPSVME